MIETVEAPSETEIKINPRDFSKINPADICMNPETEQKLKVIFTKLFAPIIKGLTEDQVTIKQIVPKDPSQFDDSEKLFYGDAEQTDTHYMIAGNRMSKTARMHIHFKASTSFNMMIPMGKALKDKTNIFAHGSSGTDGGDVYFDDNAQLLLETVSDTNFSTDFCKNIPPYLIAHAFYNK